ncbi:MAG: CopG family transcriptional regulator [Egibacteraceae bacterium]
MARAQTLVQLNDTLLAVLDQRAARRGVSRSHIIREAVEAYLADDYDSEVTRQIIAGYERIPQSTPDEWGDPTAFTSATARSLHRRLDAEERAAGHEPW